MKTKMWCNKLPVLAAAVAMCAALPAAADNIQLQGFWAGSGSASITFTNGINYHTGQTVSFTESGGSGGFQTYDSTTRQTFQSWCVDIFHDFSFGNPASTADTLKPGATGIFAIDRAKDLSLLYSLHHNDIDARTSTAANSSAFQLAVWEIVNEKGSTFSLSNGSFKASGTGDAIAQTWLTDLNNRIQNNQTSVSYMVNIWAVTNNSVSPTGAPIWGAQDVAVFTPVPEPSSYALVLAGLGLLGFSARRKMAQTPA